MLKDFSRIQQNLLENSEILMRAKLVLTSVKVLLA